ncbi:MAG: hypothetical protein WCW27_04385 [Patescibacteria group bacterium]|jgi:4-amino-4-deoxy-L-arabinose transferase-like glycosyltransferase
MSQRVKYKNNLLAYGLVLLFWCLATGSIMNAAITSDELPHIAAGYYYLTTGRYALNPEHPPLIKDLAALPLLLLHPASPINSSAFSLTDETNNEQWKWGELFLFKANQQTDTLVLLARLTIITFNTGLLLWCYFLIKQQWDAKTALLLLVAVVFNPFILAHSALVTMDVPATLLQIISLLYVTSWLKQCAGISLVITSVTLAILTKFSALLLFPVILVGLIFYLIFTRSARPAWKYYFSRYIFIVLASLILVTSVYAWQIRHTTTADVLAQLQSSYPSILPTYGLTILQTLTNFSFGTRSLAEFIYGNILLGSRLGVGNNSTYFFNHVYTNFQVSNWYFPVLFFTKLPLVLLAGLLLSLLVWLLKLKKSITEPAQLLLSIYIIFYSLLAFTTPLQIGLRHIMPIIIMLILLMAINLIRYFSTKLRPCWKIVAKTGLVISLIILSINLAYNFPYYLSYYNWLGGGTWQGYKIATDSNYDWGQDVKLLANWTKENNITTLYVDVFSTAPLDYYLGFKPIIFNPSDPLPSAGAYIAVSVFQYQNNVYDEYVPPEKKYTNLPLTKITRIGTTIFIFQVK